MEFVYIGVNASKCVEIVKVRLLYLSYASNITSNASKI
mgnify:FL=1